MDCRRFICFSALRMLSSRLNHYFQYNSRLFLFWRFNSVLKLLWLSSRVRCRSRRIASRTHLFPRVLIFRIGFPRRDPRAHNSTMTTFFDRGWEEALALLIWMPGNGSIWVPHLPGLIFDTSNITPGCTNILKAVWWRFRSCRRKYPNKGGYFNL